MTRPTGTERITAQVVAGLLLALAAGIAAGFLYGHLYWGSDLEVYHDGGAAILHGVSPYDFTDVHNQKFIYTPFAAVVFAPFGWLPLGVALGVWTFLSTLCLEGSVWVVLRHLGGLSRRRWATWTVIGALVALPLAPVMFELWVGQIELILMLLVLADLAARSERWRGYGVGVAAGIKLTPLIFVAYLLCTRRFRAAGQAVVGFLGTIAVGFAVLPRASWSYWHGTFADVSRMLPDNNQFLNQSVRGVLERTADPGLHGTGPWLVAGGLVAVLGLAVAVWASRRGQELAGVLACAVTGLLVSPLSWEHHWVWCVPVIVLCAHRAWVVSRRPVAKAGAVLAWLAFAASTVWVVQLFLLLPVAFVGTYSVIFTNNLVATGALLLIVLAVLLARSPGANVRVLPRADPAAGKSAA